MKQKRIAYKVLVGKPEGKKPLGKRRRRCQDNIKMDLKERELRGVNWTHQDQNRNQWQALVNIVMKILLQ
jgi:hypothetical protein